MSNEDSSRATRRLPEPGAGVAMVLALLLAIGAIAEAVSLKSLRGTEIWGHLRAGMWILENHSVPRTGLFSQSVRLPWRDFSWGFDTIAAVLYKLVGLRAVPGVAIGFRVALAIVLFLLAGGRRDNLWGAVLLTWVGLYTLSGVGPGSSAASVLLFGVELSILLQWRRAAAKFPAAIVLPLLFLGWANLDIGFVYGIVALVIYVVSLHAQASASGFTVTDETKRLPRTALMVLLGCVITSGVTPYGYASYAAFWRMETNASNGSIPGYAAMGFRQPLDYAVLLLAMGAFLAMGLRRSRNIFLLGLLTGASMLAFHSQRESWLVILSAVAVIGSMITAPQANEARQTLALTRQQLLVVASASLALATLAFLLLIPRDPKMLMSRVAETFPVGACDFIRSRGLEQPLFNAYPWGAFVSWYLPEYPVAIDSRRGLYPEEMEENYFKVMKADVPYQSFPAMRDAKTILLEKSNVMAEALKNVRGFRVAYEDDVATILSEDDPR